MRNRRIPSLDCRRGNVWRRRQKQNAAVAFPANCFARTFPVCTER
jgi:hypothetical protein